MPEFGAAPRLLFSQQRCARDSFAANVTPVPDLELIGFLFCLLGAAVLLARLARGAGKRTLVLLAVILQGGLTLALASSRERRSEVGVPTLRHDPRYASSASCKSCHPGEYSSWHHSFHRSMTARADQRSVRAPWRPTQLEWRGRSYELFKKGTEFWVRLPDPDRVASGGRDTLATAQSVDRRVVMTTGSHHYQAYWVQGERGELWQFPFVYHFESGRFIPRHEAFLQPPEAAAQGARWNSNCIQCHSVAGRPRQDRLQNRFETDAVELGIACEACHGPARAHVERHRNPLERYAQHFSHGPDPSIVNPKRLTPTRRSEVCGQCHAYFLPQYPDQWWRSGFSESFQAGDSLSTSRLVLDYERDRQRPEPLISASLDSIFYADGTVRVGGREYNGLIRSACYQRGRGERKLSCLSCHEMHGENPVDQLSVETRPGGHCLNCHAHYSDGVQSHTHHPPGSSGSQCENCHMPYTSYALFKGIRSHRITSPSAAATVKFGTPNACNLCHLDKSLAWTAEHLHSWYGQARPALGNDETQVPHSVLGLLKGDAALRVLNAYAMGSSEAQQASGRGWQAVVLTELLDDPYSAIRFVAARSLGTLPGFDDLHYDFLAPARERRSLQEQLKRRARLLAGSGPSGASSTLHLTDSVVRRLLAERNLTPISISE